MYFGVGKDYRHALFLHPSQETPRKSYFITSDFSNPFFADHIFPNHSNLTQTHAGEFLMLKKDEEGRGLRRQDGQRARRRTRAARQLGPGGRLPPLPSPPSFLAPFTAVNQLPPPPWSGRVVLEMQKGGFPPVILLDTVLHGYFLQPTPMENLLPSIIPREKKTLEYVEK